MGRRTRWILAAGTALVLLVVLLSIWIAALGSEWLKGKLVEQARVKLNADLKIESLAFSLFKGEAELKGVQFDRKTGASDVRASVPLVRVRMPVGPLVFRSVRIERLEADQPRIEWTVRQPPDSERPSTLGKIKKALAARMRASERKVDFSVDEFVVTKGIVEFCSLKEGRDPFVARATEIQYSARSISLDSFGRLVYGADIEANVDLGGSIALLRKKGSASPSLFALSGIDVTYADRYFDASDALVMSGGKLDLHYAIGEGSKVRFEADFRGLELGENPEAPKQEFAFVPIPRLRELVKAREGNLRFAFEMDGGAEVSEDLRLLLDEVWSGMWAALVKSVASGAVKEAIEKGKEKVLDRLKPDQEK